MALVLETHDGYTRKIMKLTQLGSLAVLTACSIWAHTATADVSATIGLASEYHWRGIAQTTDASASASLDYEKDGFYVGTATSDVNDGLEVDLYFGYGMELDGGIAASVGFTTYQYTGDFDSAYNEVTFGLGYGFASVSYSIGTHEEDNGLGIPESDFTFLALTLENNGFYGTFGTWGNDFDGEYFEVGYGTEIGGFDVGVAMIASGSDLDDDETFILSIGKTFDL